MGMLNANTNYTVIHKRNTTKNDSRRKPRTCDVCGTKDQTTNITIAKPTTKSLLTIYKTCPECTNLIQTLIINLAKKKREQDDTK